MYTSCSSDDSDDDSDDDKRENNHENAGHLGTCVSSNTT